MKTFFYIIVVVLCLNTWTIILNDVDFMDDTINPWNQSAINEDVVNASELVESWSYQDTGLYGDVLTSLNYLIEIFGGLILGFPNLLASAGLPQTLVLGVKGIWLIMWILFVIEFMSGRNVTAD